MSTEEKGSINQVADQPAEGDAKKKWIIRGIVLLVIVVLIVVAIVFRSQILEILQDFLEWVKENPVLGPIILCIVYIFCTVLFVPGSILTIGAGFAFN